MHPLIGFEVEACIYQACIYLIILQNMLFRAPGKTNNFDYPSNVHFQSVNQTNQRSVCSFNNSFTGLQKCSSQEKVGRNHEQRYVNYQNPSLVLKTQSQMGFDDEKYKQTVLFKPPPHPELSRTYINYTNLPIQQQCLILRKEKSQFSEKIRRAEQEIQTKENVIRGKQKEIEQLKLVHTQSQNSKPQNDTISELRSEKQKLYFQVIELQTEIHKMQEKYEKMQRQHYGLSQKYDELSSKSSLEMNRKISREELLQSELSLSEKRNQRLKTEFQKQINILKEKIRQSQNQSKLQNRSTVLSYNQSSFSDNYASVKSQPELENSRIQIEKYQTEIKQKNQMIRYLEMQCLRDRKKDAPEQDSNKINSLYEQCKKELSKTLKQGDVIKRQNATLMMKCTNSEKMRQDLFKQVKDLQYLLKQVRDKLCKTMEENRTINKRQRQNNEKLAEKIQQLQTQLLKSSSKFRQEMEETQKSYDKMLNDLRDKTMNQMKVKDEQIRQYSIQKQELMGKMVEYQAKIKQNSSLSAKYDQLSAQLKVILHEKQKVQSKFAEDLDQNIQRLQKQLKGKTDQLYISESTIMALEKQVCAIKKSLQTKINDISTLISQFEQQKLKYEKQLRQITQEKARVVSENQELKKGLQEKLVKEKDQEQRILQAKLKQVELKSKREEERYENLISYMREEQRKLRNMIGNQERDNLNQAISIQNEKQKNFEASQKLKAIKQEKKQLKTEVEDLKSKLSQAEELIPKAEKLKNLQNQKLSLIEKNKVMETEMQKLRVRINQMQNTNEKFNVVLNNLKAQNEKMQAEYLLKKEEFLSLKNQSQEKENLLQGSIEEKLKLNNQLQDLSKRLQQKDKEASELNSKLLDLRKQIQKQTSQNRVLSEQIKSLNQKQTQQKRLLLEQIKSLNQKEAKEKSERQQKLFQIQSELAEARSQLENLTRAQNQNSKYSEQIGKSLKIKEIVIADLSKNLKKVSQENQAKIKQLGKKIQDKQDQIIKLSNLVEDQKKKIAEKQIEVVKTKDLTLQKDSLEAIIQELQAQINNFAAQSNQQLQTIENLKKIIRQRESTQFEQRKSLEEKTQYNLQIEQSLEQLTIQLRDIKLKFLEVENQKIKSVSTGDEQQKGLTVSKSSALSESFIADFIEIDKNALLHICDILGIEPQEGEILRCIIEVIEGSNFLTISEYYREILQLFGVDPELNQKTQEILIGQIKSFRETLMSLLDKVSQLEIRSQNLSKQNHRLNKQLGKVDVKEERMSQISALLQDVTGQLISSKIIIMNMRIKDSVQQLQLQELN